MELSDWIPPPCPKCQSEDMYNLCFSHVPGSGHFRKNGWYCESCSAGPYQLSDVTEADTARFALRLNN